MSSSENQGRGASWRGPDWSFRHATCRCYRPPRHLGARGEVRACQYPSQSVNLAPKSRSSGRCRLILIGSGSARARQSRHSRKSSRSCSVVECANQVGNPIDIWLHTARSIVSAHESRYRLTKQLWLRSRSFGLPPGKEVTKTASQKVICLQTRCRTRRAATFQGRGIPDQGYDADTTGRAFSIVEEIDPLDTPAHMHTNEDELFLVLEGERVFRCGDEEFHVGRAAPCLPRAAFRTPTPCYSQDRTNS